MRVDVSFKHLPKSPLLETIIDKNIDKVQRRLKIFKSDEAIHLSFHLEKNPHRDQYQNRDTYSHQKQCRYT